MKKIAYIITRSDIGGAQNHLISLIKYFSNDYKVLLITGSEGSLTDAVRKFDVDVQVLGALDSANFVSAIAGLRRMLTGFGPDIVHTHSSLASLYGRLAAKPLDSKAVYTVHGWHFANSGNRLRSLFQIAAELLLKHFTDYWITVSQFDMQLGCKYRLFKKAAVSCIPNGIADLMEYHNEPETTDFKMVFVGRASYQKNYLAAIEVLEQTHQEVSLSIYTSGQEVPKLLQRIESSPAKDRCQVIVDESNAGSFLNQFDLMLVTSRYEGMPLCVLEALRAGLPIISTNVCGMSEVVRPQNGYLVPQDNIAEMAEYINILRTDDKLRKTMSKASRELFEAEFTESNMLGKTQSVYTGLLN